LSSFQRTAHIYLYDTCPLRCGYCHLAEGGFVSDISQLKPFQDRSFINQITHFFNKRTTSETRWHLSLTGGEPLIMPNFELFCSNLFEYQNIISLYTSLHIGELSQNFKFLASLDPQHIYYIMATLQPQDDDRHQAFFEKVRILKESGHAIILRFVGHPKRLHLLEWLFEEAQKLDVCFYPTTLFSPNYPINYTPQERKTLIDNFTSISQYIQIMGGLDANSLICRAGDAMIAVILNSAQGLTLGNISPCILTPYVSIGNIFADTLALRETSGPCFQRGISCNCDMHFQLNIVLGLEDMETFDHQRRSFMGPENKEKWRNRLKDLNLLFSPNIYMVGQVSNDQNLISARKKR